MYLLSATVSTFLGAISFAMFLRCILSFLPGAEEWRISVFVAAISEVVVAPVRVLLSRFRFVAECPFDISFMVAFLLLSIWRGMVPTVLL